MSCSSGKVIHLDKISALIALAAIQHYIRAHPHHTFRKYPVRVYRCPNCHYWHLTSKYDRRNNYHEILQRPI